MADQYVAIAKASFSASLLRADPESIPRNEIASFHTMLDETVLKCSAANVKLCKSWIIHRICPSSGRSNALGKYLAALATSFEKEAALKEANGQNTLRPSIRRKRLHLLYLLNDVFHHTVYHSTQRTDFLSLIEPHLWKIYSQAVSLDGAKYQKHNRRIHDILKVWERNAYFNAQYAEKLRIALTNAGANSSNNVENGSRNAEKDLKAVSSRDAPYTIPASHGDPSTPWYDLPAGNFLPHIRPNSTAPINPRQIKPLQFSSGPADDSLAHVVKDFLTEVDALYNVQNNDEGIVADIDDLGQTLVKDEVSGETGPKENYYGWSIAFCRKMQDRKRNGFPPAKNGLARSRSLSGSRSPAKRRRYSSSRGSMSPQRDIRKEDATRHSRGSDDSSYSPPRPDDRRRPRTRSRSRSPRRSSSPKPLPLDASFASSVSNPAFKTPVNQIDNPMNVPIPAPPMQFPPNHNFPIGPNGLPLPPPPPFHTGPWPPPPPPSFSSGYHNPGPPPSLGYGPPSQAQGSGDQYGYLPSNFQGCQGQGPGQQWHDGGAGQGRGYGGGQRRQGNGP